MRKVRSAFAVKAPRGNDASSSAKVFASTHAAGFRSLRFSGGQGESEIDHRIWQPSAAIDLRPRLPCFRAVASQNETSRVRSGDVLTVLIGDIALQIANALSAVDHARLGP